MLLGTLWSRIERTSPERVVIEGRAAIPLRVVGRGFGWLCCNGEKRLVVGRFNEVVAVDPRRVNAVELVGFLGLFGKVTRSVDLKPTHRLTAPSARMRFMRPALRLRGCSVRRRAVCPKLKLPRVRARVPSPPSAM